MITEAVGSASGSVADCNDDDDNDDDTGTADAAEAAVEEHNDANQ